MAGAVGAIAMPSESQGVAKVKALLNKVSNKITLRQTQMFWAFSNAADAVTTVACLKMVSGAQEANPLIAPNGHFSMATMVGIKLIGMATLVLINEAALRTSSEPDRPDMLSFVKKANTAASSLVFAVAAHNASYLIPH